ncbi:MAG: hypothetical protein D6734_10765 [Candidatus Schekmanbacteria bacterium]|nr:MAG: hypothetical protein D6734_10765 [Candidatus Schekmanbacteria bacterium]
MEFAFYISKEELLSSLDNNATRIYYGCEFCERLIPNLSSVERVLEFCRERNLAFSFVTPYCTDKGLSKLKEIFTVLENQKNSPSIEVIINDWGVVRLLKNEFPSLSPVLGRLMTKVKRGPRLLPILGYIPKKTREYYCSTNLDVEAYKRVLKEFNIERVELDNIYQGYFTKSIPRDLRVSLYMPFSFVSTTRFCLTAGCEDEENFERVGIIECKRECENYTFILRSKGMPVPLIRKGNSIFSKNATPPYILNNGLIDRVVLQPEIPN